MTYNKSDFEGGTCPNCGSSEIKDEHNPMNIGFLNGLGYFLDFPFGPDHSCDNCGASGPDCFIATAVYGDQNAPQVETLRQYRDNVLKESTLGRRFISFYYSGAGKKAAELIKTKLPSAIPVIRQGLDKIVERYERERQSKSR